jgi:putative chitinase
MLIDAGGVVRIMPLAAARAPVFAPALDAAMAEFSITTPRRAAAFLAQCAHESEQLVHMRELGNAAYLDKYDTGELAKRLGNSPDDDDDGQKYCGRGPIQLTGLANYKAASLALGLDLIGQPELLEQPVHGCRGSAWFWRWKGLNELADQDAFGAITLRINGGYNGLDKRIGYWLRARKLFAL